MRTTSLSRRAGHVAAAVVLALGAGAARADNAADNAADLAALKSQVQALQNQINALEARQAGDAAKTPATANTATTAAAAPTFYVGPVTVTLGGFAELIAVDRSRVEGNDWASNFNTGIPLANSSNYYLNEFHMTARQSRLSALAQSPTDGHALAEAYVETDFGAAGGTANNNESGSFSPRMRHFYGDYRNTDQGWYLLFGQTWSLVTQNNSLINPRSERAPLTIDGQYLPGFSWLRTAQLRFVKNFSDQIAFGVSLENPATLVSCTNSAGADCVGGVASASPLVAPKTPITAVPGAGAAFPGANVTLDPLPDVVGKVAFEPGYGHYEVFGSMRTFRDRFNGGNNTTTGYSYGANAVLPLLGKELELNAAYLGGSGVGRYGSAQLPDVTINPASGELSTIKAYQAQIGLTWRPNAAWVVFAYGGTEHASEDAYTYTSEGKTIGQGYGSPLFDNGACLVEGGVKGKACVGNTKSVTQETIGAWWKYYQGTLGNAQVGLQASHTTRDTFAGLDGLDPSTSINIYYLSFRFYPYQR